MGRPERSEFSDHYAPFIALVPDGDIVTVLAATGAQRDATIGAISESAASQPPPPGKWTIRETLGHLADMERVLSYRALRIARVDRAPVSGVDQNRYVANSYANQRSIADLRTELSALRVSTIALFASTVIGVAVARCHRRRPREPARARLHHRWTRPAPSATARRTIRRRRAPGIFLISSRQSAQDSSTSHGVPVQDFAFSSAELWPHLSRDNGGLGAQREGSSRAPLVGGIPARLGVGRDFASTTGWVEAPVATLVTGNARRDRDLRASMEVDRHRTMRFTRGICFRARRFPHPGLHHISNATVPPEWPRAWGCELRELKSEGKPRPQIRTHSRH